MNNFMKIFSKIIAMVMSIFYMFGGGNPDKVTATILTQPTTETTVIEYEICNYSGVQVQVGKYFTIEKNVDGNWETMPFAANDSGVPDICILLSNCQSVTFQIDLMERYGHLLDAGEYRLVLPDTKDAVPFTVTQT